jgi:2-polyprenyl-6-hydroxyphenyl methylase / 3-demethylubiquinone-9 3-methyltransferase
MPTIRLDDPDPAVLDGRHIRACAFESAQRQLIDSLSHRRPAADGAQALTIGAGYARLPQLLADAGYRVTASDHSVAATEVARQQATGEAIAGAATVRYLSLDGRQLPAPADSFDLVWCIDTLEIGGDSLGVLAEIARVTPPGGTIVLDTLNNTVASRAIYLGLFQRLPLTRVMPRGRYHRDRMITPAALRRAARIRNQRGRDCRLRARIAGNLAASTARPPTRQHSRPRAWRPRSVPVIRARTHTTRDLLRHCQTEPYVQRRDPCVMYVLQRSSAPANLPRRPSLHDFAHAQRRAAFPTGVPLLKPKG